MIFFIDIFRSLNERAQAVRSQNLESSDIDLIQRRVIGLRRRTCLELRHFCDRVDRTIHDRLRERQHVRGEAHPLLRNLSFEESSSVNATISSNTNEENQAISQSNISISNYCDVCGHLPTCLDSHMTSTHPGCGIFWGSGICGSHADGVYILCHKCKKKYSLKNQVDIDLHTRAPDIIYNEEDLVEVDIQLTKFELPNCEDYSNIRECLGIHEKVEGIPMER